MTAIYVACALSDLALIGFAAHRAWRSRREGTSLRLRIFAALAVSTLMGALFTGVYAVAEEAWRTGVQPVAARIAPKAFLLSSALLVLAAAGAALVGWFLSRSVEEITESAARIAEGELDAHLPRGRGREMRRLSRALASMRRELEGRPYAAAFLRDAWHDLKTPAAAVKATVEVLEDGAVDDPEAARRFLANLRRSSEQLEHTLDDLVTLARLETATLAEERVESVAQLTRTALDHVRPLAEAKGVTMTIEGAADAPLRCDPEAVSRALANLLDNAVKATPGGRVGVTVAEDAGAVTVEITNEPAEVPADMRDRLFQRAATSRKGSGSGLGLAITRAAVQAHGGVVRFVELGPPRVRVRVELPR